MMNVLVDDFKGWNRLDYAWLTIACVSIVFVTLSMGGSTLSIISALANIVCVVLVAKGKVSNYSWGILGVVTYAYVAYQSGYYGETVLNAAYYLPMQFIGLYLWNQHKENLDDTVTQTVRVVSLTTIQKWSLVIALPIIVYLAYIALSLMGGNLPLLDATTTVLSIVAMLFMAMRLKEQWYIWIVVDVISIYMWYTSFMSGNEDGIATLMMWIVFTINAVYGLYQWNRIEQQ